MLTVPDYGSIAPSSACECAGHRNIVGLSDPVGVAGRQASAKCIQMPPSLQRSMGTLPSCCRYADHVNVILTATTKATYCCYCCATAILYRPLSLFHSPRSSFFFCRSCREYGHGGGNRDYGQRCVRNSSSMLALLPLTATDDDDVIRTLGGNPRLQRQLATMARLGLGACLSSLRFWRRINIREGILQHSHCRVLADSLRKHGVC